MVVWEIAKMTKTCDFSRITRTKTIQQFSQILKGCDVFSNFLCSASMPRGANCCTNQVRLNPYLTIRRSCCPLDASRISGLKPRRKNSSNIVNVRFLYTTTRLPQKIRVSRENIKLLNYTTAQCTPTKFHHTSGQSHLRAVRPLICCLDVG